MPDLMGTTHSTHIPLAPEGGETGNGDAVAPTPLLIASGLTPAGLAALRRLEAALGGDAA